MELTDWLLVGFAYLGLAAIIIGVARFGNWVKKLKGVSFKQHVTLGSVLIWFLVGIPVTYGCGAIHLAANDAATQASDLLVPTDLSVITDVVFAVVSLLLLPLGA